MPHSLSSLALTPAVTGALLYAATIGPEAVRGPLLDRLRQYASENVINNLITTLKVLTGLGVVRTLNGYLNRISQNNFRLRAIPNTYHWPREIVFITGGTGGFGSILTKELAARGATIICVDIRDSAPKDMEYDSRIHYYKCDIGDRAAVMELAETVRSKHGDPTVVINNAGVAYNHGLLETPEEKVRGIFNVNILSHYWTLQAFLPAMVAANHGHVVTTASMASFITPHSMLGYCNTKCALQSFHEGLNNELRAIYKADRILTTIVHPNFAETPMVAPYMSLLEKAKLGVMRPEKVTNAILENVLGGRGGQVLVNPNDLEVGASLRAWPHWIYQLLIRFGDYNAH